MSADSFLDVLSYLHFDLTVTANGEMAKQEGGLQSPEEIWNFCLAHTHLPQHF